MKTHEKLAEELRTLGLTDMARLADEGYYHDFLSPLTFPEIQLVTDLQEASMGSPNEKAILLLRGRVINGDFDADKAESDEWAASSEGKAAFNQLIRGR